MRAKLNAGIVILSVFAFCACDGQSDPDAAPSAESAEPAPPEAPAP